MKIKEGLRLKLKYLIAQGQRLILISGALKENGRGFVSPVRGRSVGVGEGGFMIQSFIQFLA